MIKELQYKGYATEPSDYECPDGQLATSLNLINEDEQLKPVFRPKPLVLLNEEHKIIHIHKTNNFTHYIILDEQSWSLYWFDAQIIEDYEREDKLPVPSKDIDYQYIYEFDSSAPGGADMPISKVNSIGNTLVIHTEGGLNYALWKNNEYKLLGKHFPELPISFGLQAECKIGQAFEVKFQEVDETDDYKLKTEEDVQKVTETVLAQVNKFISEESVQKGRFLYPFLVRYAYHLYDDSLVMHSSPVLMMTASDVVPFIINVQSLSSNSRFIGVCFAAFHQLDYAVMHKSRIDMLKEWEDIVMSVDVFVTKPIYTYDQSGKITNVKLRDIYPWSICKNSKETTYRLQSYDYLFKTADTSLPMTNAFPIPMKTTDEVKEEIRSASQFYFLQAIKIKDLKTDRTILTIPENYLQTLTTREVMTDDYDSHDQLIPKQSFQYNGRLNIADIKKRLYDTYNYGALVPFTNNRASFSFADTTPPYDDTVSTQSFSVYYYIKQDGRDIVVEGEAAQMGTMNPMIFLYYPNPNAYQAVVRIGGQTQGYRLPMERHSMLNGSFYFGNWEHPGDHDTSEKIDIPTPSTIEERTVELSNKIYASEVNNPFHFPVLGINTVGAGTIRGISAAAKAMSQGQFGQFPLYAFTTEGVWALEVSSTGSYSARQPITRDVCINTDSITQIDSSVLFASDRGIMLLSGSKAQCITDNIFTEQPFNVLDLPGIDQLHTKLGHAADACLPMKPFLGFLAGCQMVYDYVHQRIFVYNPTMKDGIPKYTYAYVFSLKSKMWGMVFSDFASTINAYPEAQAMTHDNKLVSFSETDEQVCKGLYITRPLKLEAADVHKTISALIQRGHFQRGDVGTVLYGSRDLYTWHLIWSSKDHYLRGFRGTPYKYFRIAGLATLTDGKSIFGASVNFEPRHINQLR